jgi:pyrroline-5-carboxylate reductase
MIDIGYERLMLVESQNLWRRLLPSNSMLAGISDKPQTTSHNDINNFQPFEPQHQTTWSHLLVSKITVPPVPSTHNNIHPIPPATPHINHQTTHIKNNKMTPSLQDAKIWFCGGGNMASAIIGGLLARGIRKENISVSEPWDVNRNKFAEMGLQVSASNTEAFAAEADVAILAVKPQVAKDVCKQLGEAWGGKPKSPLVISIAAGIQLRELKAWFSAGGRAPPIVRTMPNTPALVGEGATGLYAGEDVSEAERELTSALIASVSQATEWVSEERLLDVVTGISGESSHPTHCPSYLSRTTRLTTKISRFRPSLLLHDGREPDLQRRRARPAARAGHAPRHPDLPGSGPHARLFA